MATHSSILAWKIPWTEDPGRHPWGRQESDTTERLHFTCTDDTILVVEREEELKSLLMKVKEESKKAGLKFNIQKAKIMTFSPTTSWQIDGETIETVADYFSGLQNHCRW